MTLEKRVRDTVRGGPFLGGSKHLFSEIAQNIEVLGNGIFCILSPSQGVVTFQLCFFY